MMNNTRVVEKRRKSWLIGFALVLSLIAAVVSVSAEQAVSDDEYYEDFSQSASWFSNLWNSNGYIEMTQPDELRVRSIPYPYAIAGPFFELDVLFTQCENGMAGIELVPQDTTELNYAVMVNSTGRYAIFRSAVDGSTWNYSKGWTYSRHILSGTNVVNHLTIEVTSRYALVSINDVLVTTINAEINPGGVSLAVGTIEGVTTARFDNLWIYPASTSDME